MAHHTYTLFCLERLVLRVFGVLGLHKVVEDWEEVGS